MLPCVTEQKPN